MYLNCLLFSLAIFDIELVKIFRYFVITAPSPFRFLLGIFFAGFSHMYLYAGVELY